MALFDNPKTTITRAFAITVVDESKRGAQIGDGEADDGEDGSPAPAAVLPSVRDIVGEHYRLVRLLGEGMFGKVYVAQRIDVPEHQVALKLLPRSVYAGRNVERELVMLAQVGHPNMVQLKDHGWTDEYVWFTMPVYEGETLAERLERGPLSLREGHDVFLAIGRALEALHVAGLRHQDIKPENIYLATFGGRVHPILLDLGVAAEKEATFVAGTALFASPEQLLAITGVPGAVPLTEKMDTYCLAATLLVSLVGQRAFPGDGAKARDEIVAAHDERAKAPLSPEALPDLVGEPRDLIAAAFARWMALDPLDRPSMSKMCEELDVLLEPERAAAREEQRRQERQKALLWRFRAAAGVMFVAGLGALAYGYSRRETLRLAGELDKARQAGADSFDKLDTCVASHAIARSEEAVCRKARDADKVEFKATLDSIARSGSGSEAEHAKQLATLQTSYANRLKTCEEEAAASDKAAAAEKEQCAKDRAALVTEHKASIDKTAAELEVCAAERLACFAERDTLKGASAQPAPATATARPSATPAAPTAASTSAPAQPSPPVATAAQGAPPAPQPTATPQAPVPEPY